MVMLLMMLMMMATMMILLMMKMMLMTTMMKVDLFSVVSTVSSSEKRYEDNNIWLSRQIQLAILTNTTCNFDKYFLKLRQIHDN